MYLDQAYVALSRASSAAGLRIVNLDLGKITPYLTLPLTPTPTLALALPLPLPLTHRQNTLRAPCASLLRSTRQHSGGGSSFQYLRPGRLLATRCCAFTTPGPQGGAPETALRLSQAS